MSSPDQIRAVNPLPPVVVAMFLVFLGIELVFQAGTSGLVGGPQAIGWRNAAIETYHFNGAVLTWMWETGQWPLRYLIRLVSYPFVNANFTSMLIGGVMFLAMGKLVAETFGALAMLAIFFGSAIGGALIYTIGFGSQVWLLGVFPPVYGLIGAFTFLLWRRLATLGSNQTRAFTLIAVLMGLQLLFGLFFGLHSDWLADLGGFVCGFLLSFLLVPGGWARVLARLRQE